MVLLFQFAGLSIGKVGNMFAWMSMKSFGVVLSIPVIARAAIRCILVRLHRKVTDPDCLDCPSFLLGGVPCIDAIGDFRERDG